MEREANPGPAPPLKKSMIRLPKVKMCDEVKNSSSAVRNTLLGLFRQSLLPMCATQRYFFANQPRILIQEFETFEQASLLYEENLLDTLTRGISFAMLRGTIMTPSLMASERKKKARASLVSTFGLLLELNTLRTFWRMIELTTEAFILLLERYDEEADDQVVLSEKAKAVLLQWIGHVFWSLRHAQYVLNEFRKCQHVVYQREDFPFYPVDMDALKAGLDVHLIIAKLSRGPIHDFHFMASAFSELRQASEFPEQMSNINSATMVAIDEMSARFRVLELLTRIGQLLATTIEVKKALISFRFDPSGAELNSTMDDAVAVITGIASVEERKPTPANCSFLQTLLVQENQCRSKHKEAFLRLPVPDTRKFTKEMFDVFKPTYTKLYRESIRLLWKAHERSLLSSEVSHRIEHRREVQKKKNHKKKASMSRGSVGKRET
ncbi:hypothetical protein O6H91_04G015700 [Diphasiastrum complanatum]|uniref:Uncharacterized protein n=1 Tax=Diphasiastrum complanatum TaxID=34168 RepID=A0ACC2DUJ0_DIPCM|nr:hypothetical protein O6H91_04G015700 [Diphasiastrum complanatum]